MKLIELLDIFPKATFWVKRSNRDRKYRLKGKCEDKIIKTQGKYLSDVCLKAKDLLKK